MRRISIATTILMVLIFGLALTALAQEATPAVDGVLPVLEQMDAVGTIILPGWLLVVIALAVMLVLAGLLLILNRALAALKESYPAGTVETVTRAVGDGLELILTQLRDAAPTTKTNVDDFLLAVTEPLTKALVEALRGASPPTTPSEPGAEG